MKAVRLISRDIDLIPVMKRFLKGNTEYNLSHFQKIIDFIKSIEDYPEEGVILILDMESVDLQEYSSVLNRIRNDIGFPIIYLYGDTYGKVYKGLSSSVFQTYMGKDFSEGELLACLREASLKILYEKRILALNNRLERQDNYLRVGMFASSFIHEMNNLHSYLGHSFQNLQSSLGNHKNLEELKEGVEESLEKSTEVLKMLTENTTRYKNLLKGKTGAESEKNIDLSVFVESLINIFSHNFTKNDYILTQENKDSLIIRVDEVTLLQTMINLISNAFDELKNLPQDKRWVKINYFDEEDHVFIEVVDGGEGVPENIIPYIFEKDFSTKDSSSTEIGAGVGLGVCLERVRENIKGDIFIVPTEPNTTFRISIPKIGAEKVSGKNGESSHS